MSTVTGGVNPTISFTLTGQVGTNPLGTIPEVLNFSGNFQPGSLADQIAFIHANTYNFVASTPQTPDLTSLLDIQGNPISFAVVRFFAYRIQASNPLYVLTVGGAGANEWNGRLTSGSKEIWYPSTNGNSGYTIVQAPSLTGMPVNSGSKLLKMDPGTNSVGLVDLIIAGS